MTIWQPARETVRLRNATTTGATATTTGVSLDGSVVQNVPVYGAVPANGSKVLVLEQGGSLLVVPRGVADSVGSAYGQVASQTVPNATSTLFTLTPLTSTGGVTVSGTQIRPGKVGWWSLMATLSSSAGYANGVRAFIEVYMNGSTLLGRTSIGPGENIGTVNVVHQQLATTDYLSIRYYQASGGAALVSGHFMLKFLGAT